MEPLLELKNLSKNFGRGKQQVKALKGINLEVNKGETLGIVGESGSGKSTLARTIMGVYTPAEGDILFHGKPMNLSKQKARKDFARQVQMIFQDPYTSLDPRMTVEDILMENLEIQGEKSKEENRVEVERLLEMVGLSKDFRSRYPYEFSGGQRQRIGIARALALEPEMLICDEPISALDISIQSQIMNLLIKLKKEKNLTLVFIAHDLNMVRYISDRIAVMYQGEIVETGETEDIYENPKHPYTKTLLNAALTLENHMEQKRSKKEIMEKIKEVRYSDLELEKTLCLELLEMSTEKGDTHGIAFAHAYLGDYYVAYNDIVQVENHLGQAKTLVETLDDCDDLKMRIHILLGIYYETQTDEQNAIQNYLHAMTLAEKLGDKGSQCTILNNVGVTFQRQKNNRVSLDYFERAYKVLQEEPDLPIRTRLLSNLADMSLLLGDMEKAKKYITECNSSEDNGEEGELFLRKNWCCYYARLGDSENAVFWAKKVLELTDWCKKNRFDSFENYDSLCDAMLRIENKEFARAFFGLMEESCGESLDQLRPLEEKRLRYTVSFEPEEVHGEAYQRFYRKYEEFRTQVNMNIVSAMQTKMDIEKVNEQKELLQRQQKDLEEQVNLDELTRIFNRRFLDEKMAQWSRGQGIEPFGVIMLDVDYFKEYNDSYGHLEGDNVLATIGACLKKNASDGMYPCRFGGDEFACLCEGKTAEEMEKYIIAVRNDLDSRGLSHRESTCSNRVTLSIGYTNQGDHQEAEIYLLLQMADQALYKSKLAGRNTYQKK